MSDVVWFGDPACLEVACAGGKGASLAAMTAQGLPVPAGFVVAAGVLEASVDAASLRELAVSDFAPYSAAPIRSAKSVQLS